MYRKDAACYGRGDFATGARTAVFILLLTSFATGCSSAMLLRSRATHESTAAAFVLPDTGSAHVAATATRLPTTLPAQVRSSGPSDTIWTIERGSYAGMQVPLRLEAALGRSRKGEHFWRLPPGGAGATGVVGWRSTRYPIAVALRRGRSAAAVSAGDSAAFWSIVEQMNVDLGMKLFRPQTVEPDDDPDDAILVDVRPMNGKVGFTRTSWSQSGELFDVRVTFRDTQQLHDANVVSHEMMHALGFGHTTSWPSVVSSREASFPGRLSPEDVAYAEVAMRSREKQEATDMRNLIALAVAREPRQSSGEGGFAPCDRDTEDSFAEEPMRNRLLLPLGLLTVAAGCPGNKNDSKGPDTIAIPAAVDTTTDRLPGATPRAEGNPATGVDTPLTRKTRRARASER